MKWLGLGIATVGIWGGLAAAVIFGGEQVGDAAAFAFFAAMVGTIAVWGLSLIAG